MKYNVYMYVYINKCHIFVPTKGNNNTKTYNYDN